MTCRRICVIKTIYFKSSILDSNIPISQYIYKILIKSGCKFLVHRKKKLEQIHIHKIRT